MRTEYLGPNEVDRAAALLREGELLAFPTETVYGLGANALSEQAVQRIFQAKGRPSDNPLIIHLASRQQLEQIVRSIPSQANRLMDAFWPGPLTLVFSKLSIVPNNVTAGLDTVAVRIPSHPIALSILKEADIPVAAPSANRSGRPSSTTWQAVAEDLDGRIAGIVCGEPASFGLESTVVDISTEVPRLLRPGGITLERLRVQLPNVVVPSLDVIQVNAAEKPFNSPGLRHKHYQPKARIKLVTSNESSSEDSANRLWYIGIQEPAHPNRYSKVWCFPTVEHYSARVFDLFRRADQAGVSGIECEVVSESGLGAALMDRLRRASEA